MYKPPLYLRLNFSYINYVYMPFFQDRMEKIIEGENGMLKMGNERTKEKGLKKLEDLKNEDEK